MSRAVKVRWLKTGKRRLQSILMHLSSWNLVSSRKTTGQKGNVSTNEFKLTNFGNLLVLLIETEFAEHKEKAFDQLYQYLQSYFMNQSYSLDEFCISYFEKSRD